MADFSSSHSHSHLEKMGRELKCPICLSLLSSAVSLTCNHVFCNSCIEKSMKSASSCPVCKVPYRRREIRPAPHMDNLVSIYKSMEVASGVNIFVTQNVPSTKLSDEENQSEGGRIFGRQESGRTCHKTTENQRKCKRRRSKQLLKINQENSDLDTVKPSFPTKKRVQVPQYPPSQKPATFEGGMDEMKKFQPEKSSGALKENPSLNEKGEAFFTPFFWLRDDEDVEKLTQPTYGDHNMETPPNVPCFSDIKDSGDEIPSKVSPKGGTNMTLDDADYFDSEMFEWTQRPCSPELCSSPVKTQVKKCKLSQQNAATTGKQGTDDLETVVSKHQTNHVEVSLTALSSPRSNDTKTDGRMKISIKRGRKASGKSKKKQDKKSKGEVLGVQVDPEKVADGTVHEKKYNNDVNPLDLKKRILTRDKKVIFDDSAAELLPKNNSALSLEANPLNQDNNTVGSDLRASTNPKDSSIRSISRKRDHRKSSKFKITTNLKCDQVARCSKKQKITTDDITMDNKFNGVQDGCVEASTENTESLAKFQSNSEFSDLPESSETEKARPASNGVVLRKCGTVSNKILCAFCHSAEDSEASGVMVHYLNGKPVAEDYNGGSKVIHAHRNCTEWAPNVYFEDDNVINLEAELKRSRRIKCCCCDIKGAALGCYEKSCRKSFHIPCAKLIPQCRWDNDNFVMLCPLHASSKLPNEISGSQMEGKKKCIPKRSSKIHQSEIVIKHTSNTCWHWNSRSSFGKLVLCCSALIDEEKEIVSDFERLSGVVVLKKWDSNVTHVIASTDQNGACKRTLKVLMGILEGKWILNFEWIKACMKAMEPVDEQLYEIGVDIHGIRDGPLLGRLRVLNKQPKLFNGCKFYFAGEFVPSYKGYLHDLVIAAGGTVLQRKPISRDQELMFTGNSSSSTFIIYSHEVSDKSDPNKRNLILNQRRLDAEALACSTGAIVASNSWVLNSISAYKLQNLAE